MEPSRPGPAERLAPSVLAPRLARELGIAARSIEPALILLATGAHPPFVARYRRERTRGLDIEALESISSRAAWAAKLEFRREGLRAELDKAGRLDSATARTLEQAQDGVSLDDLRLRLRTRRKGSAGKARADGLADLATALWGCGAVGPMAEAAADPSLEPVALAQPFVQGEVSDVAVALEGARALCIESLAEFPPLRAALRDAARADGTLAFAPVEEKREKAKRYGRFFDKKIACAKVSPTDVLAILRGEREGAITVETQLAPETVVARAREILGIDPERPCGKVLDGCVLEAWTGMLGRGVWTGVRKRMKEAADAVAVRRYCDVLRPLLLAPPLGPVPVLAIDPGFQNGCRVVVLEGDGNPVLEDTLFPLQPKLQAPQAKARIGELVRIHKLEAIAVGSAKGGRDVERLCRELLRESEDLDVPVVTVETDAAALFASSRTGKEEFKDTDAAYRRAVSLGRRLRDPLAELARVDLRKLGLGQFQHEVDQDELRAALDQVLNSCVNMVGVPVNTASADALARVCGLSHAAAKAVIAFRAAHGPFRTRTQLLDVPGIPGKAFEQASGFLRLDGGEHPLDATRIHPERYSQLVGIARDVGVPLADVIGNEDLLKVVSDKKTDYLGQPGVSGEPLGEATFEQILQELRTPGKDIRPEFSAAGFIPQVESFDQLKAGMEIEGIVTHLATFGVFVDVGLSEEGLVHVSELAHTYVASPFEAVHVGQRVKARVLGVDPQKKRFALSFKALVPRPERPESKQRRRKPRKSDKGDQSSKGGKGDKGGKSERGDRPRDRDRDRTKRRGKKPDRSGPRRERKPDRVLNFRMDLSDLAARLEEDT